MQASRAMSSFAPMLTVHAYRVHPRTMLAVAVAMSVTIFGAHWLDRALELGGGAAWRAGLVAIVGAGSLLALCAKHLPGAAFGVANKVTLARGSLVVLLSSFLTANPSEPLAWAIVTVATVAALLDVVDGRLARSRGETSAFGARFDMETDALLILVLALLVWQQGKAGIVILLAGLLRYVFVLAGRVWPALGAALPPSRRRQTVCVLQIVALIVALAPIVAPPLSAGVALAGLALLLGSFAVDVAWLLRRASV